MRDDERIEMYFKFGVLDFKNEENLEKIKFERHERFVDFIRYIKKFIIKIQIMFS